MEMTIEQKAKAYDEALTKAKNIVNSINVGLIGKDSFEAVFPELKESEESEGENIRKYLSSFVELNSGFNLPPEDAKKMLAWLEKQGEQKYTKKDIDDAYLKGVCDTKRELEKQGEQKQVVIPKFRVGDIIRWKKAGSIEYTIKEICDKGYINTADGIMDISQTDIEFELVEQNPIKHNNDATIDSNLNDYCCKVYNALHKENGGNLSFERLQHLAMDIYKWCKEQQTPAEWSEEDEARFESCIKLLQTSDGYDTINAKWLKSLKDRVQPKQEWSEEDEDMRDDIIRYLKRLSGDMVSPNQPYQKEIQWLKSLRTQTTWKPSGEQMRVLDLAIRCGINRGTTEEITLVSLFNDLKKLTE